jgi:diguanylate cyclase (GGDEF)-like protein/PAS domain S-box-containing protein
LTYDEHGIVRECNPAMAEMLGLEAYVICESPITFTFRTEDELNPILGVVADVIQNGARCEFEWTHHNDKKGAIHAAYLSYPLKNAYGAILGGIVAGFDLTARKEAERKLRESEERFNTAVEASSTGLFDWQIVNGTQHWSPRVNEILGLEASFVPGPNSLTERLHPDDREKMLLDLEEHLEGRTPAYSHEFRVRRDDGADIWVHVRGEAMRNEHGQPVRMAGAIDDIDDRKRAELALAESEARFRGVTEAAGEFVFEVNRKGVFTLVTDRIEEVLGFAAKELVGTHVDQHWPGAFREFFRQGMGAALRRREKVSNAIIWGTAKSGEKKCFRLSASPILDGEGRYQGYRGTGLDVTEQRIAENALAEAHKMLHDTLESIRDCFYSLDSRLRFTFANHAACMQLGVNNGELLGRGILEVCTPGLSRLLEPKLQQTLENRKEQTFELLDPDTGAWCHYRVYPREHGVSVFYQDITERKSIEAQIEAQMLEINEKNMILQLQQKNLEDANRRLATLATTDGLTGLKNHKTFQASLAEGYEEAKEEGAPISLIMLDVDHFKLYNDAFGHPAGDEVLRSVALVLRSLARKEDVVARYGGEEFAILLPRTSSIDAMMVAERIRKGIADHHWNCAAVTASLGVACWDGGTATRAEFLDQADTALYISKRSGRNCVTLATEEMPTRQAA